MEFLASLLWTFLIWIYLPLSLLLYFCPRLLHGAKHVFRAATKPLRRIKIIAHRGGSREGLENTVGAFRNAVSSIGVDGIEMDVYLTKDLKPVVFHDANLRRMTGLGGRISDYNYSELPRLMQWTELHFADGGAMYNAKEGDTLQIPLLSDVLPLAKNKLIYLELKEPTDQTIHIVGNMIRSCKLAEQTTWVNPHFGPMRIMKREFGEISLWCTQTTIFVILLATLVGFLPFLPITEDCFCIPYLTPEFELMINQELRGSLGKAVLRRVALLMARLLNWLDWYVFPHLKRRGIEVVYWVLNRPGDFERAVKAGVDGIITDRPSLLNDYLIARQ